MRLTDLVRGRIQDLESSQKVDESFQRLSPLLRTHRQPAPPSDDPFPQHGGAVPQPATQELTPLSREPASGDVRGKNLQAAKQAFHRAVAIMEEISQSVRARASFSIAKVEETVGVLLENLETSDALLVPFFSA
ncbi:MAG: hypothetical protein ACE5EW_05730, partial [Thermoplasmata archaeon]